MQGAKFTGRRVHSDWWPAPAPATSVVGQDSLCDYFEGGSREVLGKPKMA